jgi:hypothetical protein
MNDLADFHNMSIGDARRALRKVLATSTSAADLPFGSVVGSVHTVWFKDREGWACAHSDHWYADSEIDALLKSGDAHVLRTGRSE